MKFSTTILLGAALLTSCAESSTGPLNKVKDHDLGVVERIDEFEVALRMRNDTPRTWVFERSITTCGCIGVKGYTDRVAPGEVAVARMSVRPIDRFGKQTAALRLEEAGGGFISWNISGIFASKPFFKERHYSTSIGPSEESFEASMIVRALPSAGEPRVDGLELFGQKVRTEVRRLPSNSERQVLSEWEIRMRGASPLRFDSQETEVVVHFSNVSEAAQSVLEVARRTSIVVSPLALLLPSQSAAGTTCELRYELEDGLSLSDVQLDGTARDTLRVVRDEGAVTLEVLGALASETTDLRVVLSASNGDRRVVPICVLGNGE